MTKFDAYTSFCTRFMVLQTVGISVVGIKIWVESIAPGTPGYADLEQADAVFAAALVAVFVLYHYVVYHRFQKTRIEHEDLFIVQGDNGQLRCDYVPLILQDGEAIGQQYDERRDDDRTKKRRHLRSMYCAQRANFLAGRFVGPKPAQFALPCAADDKQLEALRRKVTGLLQRATPSRIEISLKADIVDEIKRGSMTTEVEVSRNFKVAEATMDKFGALITNGGGLGYIDAWVEGNVFVAMVCPVMDCPGPADDEEKPPEATEPGVNAPKKTDLSHLGLKSASQAAEAAGPWGTAVLALAVVLANVSLMVGM